MSKVLVDRELLAGLVSNDRETRLDAERRMYGVLANRPAQTEQQPVAVPDGWLLAPAEPSAEMLRAAQDALASEGLSVSEWMVHLTYRAAIGAALAAKEA